MKESVLILLLQWNLLLEIIKRMYLYGASGHAKVIIDILRANNEPIEALFDDNEKIRAISIQKCSGVVKCGWYETTFEKRVII